jgi:NADH-quinone oxidoreductase subunit E
MKACKKADRTDRQEGIDLGKVDQVIAKSGSGPGALIPVLQKVQDVIGYLPKPVLDRIAAGLHVPAANVYGVATFFAQFRFKPVGKYVIKVCHGTACHVAGGTKITEAFERELQVKDGETTPDRVFTLESVACLGCCSLAPVAMVQKEAFGRLSGDKVAKVLTEYKQKEGQPTERQ